MKLQTPNSNAARCAPTTVVAVAFTEVSRVLSNRQRSIYFAACIELLIVDNMYDSPMFGAKGEGVKRLISKIAAATPQGLAESNVLATHADLEGAVREQADLVSDSEREAEEWTTGKLNHHEDAWIPRANASRARDGRVILQWLTGMWKTNWACSNDIIEIESVLTHKGEKWLKAFVDVKSAVHKRGQLVEK